MKICLVIDDYLPNSIKVGAKMMHELALEFLSQGHSVTVITPEPGLETYYQIDDIEGVEIWRFRSGPIKNVNKITRAINETLLPFKARIALSTLFHDNPHEIIVYYSPTIFWGSLIKYLKQLWRAPSYLILRDIFPQWAIDRGLIKKNSFIEKYFLFFEKLNYENADIIGLMSARNLEWFRQNKANNWNLEILPNWAADSFLRSSGKYRKQLSLENKIIFFYGGNIGHAQDMMNIVRLAERMKPFQEVHFLLVGSGDEVNLVKNEIVLRNLTNMTLLPPLPQTEFKKLLAEIDVGLFTLHKDHTTHNFPGKLLGYMVQSIPILGSVNPGNDLKELLEKEKAGLITINGEDDLFFENAIKLLDTHTRKSLGANAKKLLEKTFSVSSAAKNILESLKSIYIDTRG